jgi:hypothetical protein
MADRHELLAEIADHIGVLERWKRGTPEWWTRQQTRPGSVTRSTAEGERTNPPMGPVTEPELIFHEPVEDTPQTTKPPLAPTPRRPKNVREAVAQLRVGLKPANSVEVCGEVPNW